MFTSPHRLILLLVLLLTGADSTIAETRMKRVTPEDEARFQAYLNSPEFKLAVYRGRIEALERENERLRLRLEVYTSKHPLSKLKEGMARTKVERLLGRPLQVKKISQSDSAGGPMPLEVATYHLRLPDQSRDSAIRIVYRPKKSGWVFVEWQGPDSVD
jgi:hypothetical protein